GLGVAEALEPRCISRELVVPEITGAHAGRDHQIIEPNLANARARGGGLNRAGSNVDAGDLRQEYGDVSLLRLELTDWRSDLGGGGDRCRHLIEQRLEDGGVAAGGYKKTGLCGAPRAGRAAAPADRAGADNGP